MNHQHLTDGSDIPFVSKGAARRATRQNIGSGVTSHDSVRLQNYRSKNIGLRLTQADIVNSLVSPRRHNYLGNTSYSDDKIVRPRPIAHADKTTTPARNVRLRYTFLYSILKQLHYESESRAMQTRNIGNTRLLAGETGFTYAGSQNEGERSL